MSKRAYCIRIPDDTYQLLKITVQKNNISINQQILILIHDWLGLHDPQQAKLGRPFGAKSVKRDD